MAGYQTYQSQQNNRDHILTNSFIDRNFKAAIFKSYISDYFPIYFIIPSTKPKIETKTCFIFKKIFNF